MAQYEPELLDLMMKSISRHEGNENIAGIKMGKQQADREQILQQLKDGQKAKGHSKDR